MAIAAEPLRELSGLDWRDLPEEVLRPTQPMVLRGLVAHWPMVQAARRSHEAAIEYLLRFASEQTPPAVATVGPPEIGGRFFYNEDLSDFNFRREKVPMPVALKTLRKYLHEAAPPAIYLASTTIDTWLPGFRQHNDLPLPWPDALASIWIGNRTRIAAHQDVPDNIACVVGGRRRVTLFPPDQLRNLYIGPLDLTPAGQPISLVDFEQPDLERFPRFAQAQRHALGAELEPGDALVIPSMWWHHMEGLEPFNVLVNYWWRQTPAWMDTPMNALMLALLTVRDLPPAQREIWREVFRHYVFEAGDETAAHLPEPAQRVLGTLDADRARDLRARLLHRLNR